MRRIRFSDDEKTTLANIEVVAKCIGEKMLDRIKEVHPEYPEISHYLGMQALQGEIGVMVDDMQGGLLQEGKPISVEEFAAPINQSDEMKLAGSIAGMDMPEAVALFEKANTLWPLVHNIRQLSSAKLDSLRPLEEIGEEQQQGSKSLFRKKDMEFKELLEKAKSAWKDDSEMMELLGGMSTLKEEICNKLPDFKKFELATTPEAQNLLAEELIVAGQQKGRGGLG